MKSQRRGFIHKNPDLNDELDFIHQILNNKGKVYTRVTQSYNATIEDERIACSGGLITISLPDPRKVELGREMFVNDESGNASASGFNITVKDASGGKISGATSQTISTDFGGLRFYSNKLKWFVW